MIFVIYRGQEDEGQSCAFLEILIITGLKSYAILSVVDRNVAIFTTRHAITRYEFQVRTN